MSHSFSTIVSKIAQLVTQLEKGKISCEELAELEELTQKAYQRSVILNYKSKEEQVYQKVEANKTQQKVKIQPEVKQPQPTGAIEFDFSEGLQEDNIATDKSIEKEVSSSEKEEKHEVVSEQVNKEDDNNYYSFFITLYEEAMKDKLTNSKINAIGNAVGLNDRLQFINELFDSSQESFQEAITNLDDAENHQKAFQQLAEIATKRSWDKDSKLVVSFASLVNRRYAN